MKKWNPDNNSRSLHDKGRALPAAIFFSLPRSTGEETQVLDANLHTTYAPNSVPDSSPTETWKMFLAALSSLVQVASRGGVGCSHQFVLFAYSLARPAAWGPLLPVLSLSLSCPPVPAHLVRIHIVVLYTSPILNCWTRYSASLGQTTIRRVYMSTGQPVL